MDSLNRRRSAAARRKVRRLSAGHAGLPGLLAALGLLLGSALASPARLALAAGAAGAAGHALDAGGDAAASVAAAAWTEHAAVAPPSQPALPLAAGPLSPARKYFSDVELVDQDGQTHRFYSDLLQGKTVVIEAFFTSCTGSCPVLGQKLAALQEWLGDRLGKDVYLLSFSVDPQHDTPARLKQYAGQLGARPGWFFLTGKKENVDWALYKVGHYVEQKEDHSNLLIVGNEATGLWKKIFGLAPSADLIHSLDGVLHDRG
jgi:protein SCO1/2